MQREIEHAFRDRMLLPQSTLLDVKYIGEYLYSRLHRVFTPGSRQPLTIRRFARAIRRLDTDELKERLQRGLQNARANHPFRNEL